MDEINLFLSLTASDKMFSKFVLAKVFIPSFIVTVMSWGSFCLPLVDFAARILIPLSCLVSVVIIYEGSSSNSWNLDAQTHSDINAWLIGCLVFISAVIIEFFFAVKEYRSLANQGLIRVTNYREKDEEKSVISFLRVDRWCRTWFPILFAAFTSLYFYIIWLKSEDQSVHSKQHDHYN